MFSHVMCMHLLWRCIGMARQILAAVCWYGAPMHFLQVCSSCTGAPYAANVDGKIAFSYAYVGAHGLISVSAPV